MSCRDCTSGVIQDTSSNNRVVNWGIAQVVNHHVQPSKIISTRLLLFKRVENFDRLIYLRYHVASMLSTVALMIVSYQ